MPAYDKKTRAYKAAGQHVAAAMHRRKKGTMYSSSGKKVTSAAQAIAIGLSEEGKSNQDACILGSHGLAGGHAGFGRSI
jgi:hypothetical protein